MLLLSSIAFDNSWKYKRIFDITDEFIVYSKKELRYKVQKEYEVCIDFNCYDKYLLTKNKMYFTMQELQAINEKVKELGWNE